MATSFSDGKSRLLLIWSPCYSWNIAESGVKHNESSQSLTFICTHIDSPATRYIYNWISSVILNKKNYLINRYISRKNIDGSLVVYSILLSWPKEPVLILGAPIPSPVTVVIILGFPNVFIWNFGPENKGIYIEIPTISWHLMPSDWAWTLTLTYLEN